MADDKNKTLTTRFDSQTWAEFSASVEILGFRSINSLIHQLVMQKIREAKAQIAPEEFKKIVDEQKEGIARRSRMKTKERLAMIGEPVPEAESEKQLEFVGEILPRGKKTVKILPGGANIETDQRKAG